MDKEKRYVAARLVGRALIGRFLKKLGKTPVRFDSFFTEKESWIKKNAMSRHASLGMP
ncbi:MAG: hypothetical protein IKD23_07545 [Lentisphaeria bacterium]|nr:hypothetical protein [Lentisphaeria bacterium]MBR2721010.1 hypothetical protein [Lentisphaeria bacterium]